MGIDFILDIEIRIACIAQGGEPHEQTGRHTDDDKHTRNETWQGTEESYEAWGMEGGERFIQGAGGIIYGTPGDCRKTSFFSLHPSFYSVGNIKYLTRIKKL